MKKFLKIAGFVLLIFFILYFGLMIALGGVGRITGDKASSQPAGGAIGMFQSAAPSAKSGRMLSTEIAMDSIAEPGGGAIANIAADVADKKIIKTGNLSLKVEKADAAAEGIANIAKLNNGEVANSSFSESNRGIKSGYITVRVPFQNFTAVFNEIKKIATQVISESANAQDITEEYIDLEARLKNKRAEEASFVALLNRSGKIEEILAVTREVARTRGEIEQLDGRLRYLNSQTDMSAITVNLSEDVEIASASVDWRPWQVIKTSVKQLITGGQNFVDGLIRFIIIALPMLLLYGLIIWLIYYIGKKIYNRFNKPGQQ